MKNTQALEIDKYRLRTFPKIAIIFNLSVVVTLIIINSLDLR